MGGDGEQATWETRWELNGNLIQMGNRISTVPPSAPIGGTPVLQTTTMAELAQLGVGDWGNPVSITSDPTRFFMPSNRSVGVQTEDTDAGGATDGGDGDGVGVVEVWRFFP